MPVPITFEATDRSTIPQAFGFEAATHTPLCPKGALPWNLHSPLWRAGRAIWPCKDLWETVT